MVAQTFATAISVLALCSQCKRGAYCLHLAPNPPAHIGIDREEPRLDENLSGLRRRRNIKRPRVKVRHPLRVFCEKRTAVYSIRHGIPSREPRRWARFERAALSFQGRSQARSRPMENGFDGVRKTIVSVGRVQFRHGQNMLVRRGRAAPAYGARRRARLQAAPRHTGPVAPEQPHTPLPGYTDRSNAAR